MDFWPHFSLKPLGDVRPGSLVLLGQNRTALAFAQAKQSVDQPTISHVIDLESFEVTSAEQMTNDGQDDVCDLGNAFTLCPGLDDQRSPASASEFPVAGELFQDHHNRLWLLARYHDKTERFGLNNAAAGVRREFDWTKVRQAPGIIFRTWSVEFRDSSGRRYNKRAGRVVRPWMRADL